MSKTAFVFPGQGSQYVGMGLEIAKESSIALQTFEEADDALGFKISEICFNGPEEKLRQTSFTQPAILTHSIAISRVLQENGLVCAAAAGHSLGEYSALVTTGVLDFKDAVKLVHIRGKLMEEAFAPGKGTMAAIMGISSENVDKLCEAASDVGVVQAANYNSPGQIVIAGAKEAVEKAAAIAKDFGAKRAIMLNVSGPFHSMLMSKAAEKFADYLNNVQINDPSAPVIANYNAKPLNTSDNIKHALLGQIANPVLWEQSIHTMISMGINTFIEVGPGKVLTGLIKKISSEMQLLSTDDKDSLIKCIALFKECG